MCVRERRARGREEIVRGGRRDGAKEEGGREVGRKRENERETEC